MAANSENKSTSKLPLLGNVALIIGLIVVIAGGVAGWLLPPPPSPTTEPIAMVEEPIPSTNATVADSVKPPEEPIMPVLMAEDVLVLEEPEESLAQASNRVPGLPIKYYVQVANCLDRECVGQNRRLLSRQGYRTRVETATESLPFQEVRSQPIYSLERAASLADEINEDPSLTGYAQIQQQEKWYHLSLGVFPEMDQAERLTSALNTKFANRLSFEHKELRLDFEHFRVYAGGYREEKEAQRLKVYLERREPLFLDLFVTALLPRD